MQAASSMAGRGQSVTLPRDLEAGSGVALWVLLNCRPQAGGPPCLLKVSATDLIKCPGLWGLWVGSRPSLNSLLSRVSLQGGEAWQLPLLWNLGPQGHKVPSDFADSGGSGKMGSGRRVV